MEGKPVTMEEVKSDLEYEKAHKRSVHRRSFNFILQNYIVLSEAEFY